MAIQTPPPSLGAPCPDFRLPAVDGQTHALSDFAQSPVLVVMFICNHCPYVQAVEDRLIHLGREYGPRGVQFVGVCANDAASYPDDAFDKLAARWRDKAYGFPYLHDESQTVARAFDAVCTPDIFVYDSARRLAYRGRIDDSWKDESKVTRRELAAALDALLAGRGPRQSSGRRWGARSSGETRLVRKTSKGDPAAKSHLKEPWLAYLRRKGLKTTTQREAIVDAFLGASGHVALEDLLINARKKHPRVGLATVYRTVKLMEEAGLAASRQFGSGHTLYELAGERAHHDHLICESCGFIQEFESDEIEQMQATAARRLGFNVLRHRHELFGLCEKAQGIPGGHCPAEAPGRRGRE